jgi:predicted GTPase
VRGKRALVVEDGPTLTHGEMKYGAGVLLARELGATLVDPRPWVTGEIRDTFAKYPSIGTLLPAMGYGKGQIADLEATINAADCDVVVVATPVNLTRLLRIDKPSVFVNYELREKSKPDLTDRIGEVLARSGGKGRGGA